MKKTSKRYVVTVDGEKWLTRTGIPVRLRSLAAELPREEADRLADRVRVVYGRKAVSVVPVR